MFAPDMLLLVRLQRFMVAVDAKDHMFRNNHSRIVFLLSVFIVVIAITRFIQARRCWSTV